VVVDFGPPVELKKSKKGPSEGPRARSTGRRGGNLKNGVTRRSTEAPKRKKKKKRLKDNW